MSELQNCIQIHEHYLNSTSLTQTLGDGFLYAKSPLFRTVRDLVIQNKYTLVNELSEDSRDYFLTGLFQMEKILFHKKLYARQNATALKKLVQNFPEIDIEVSEVATHEVYSSLFHESIHALMNEQFNWTSIRFADHQNKAEFVRQMLTAEAAAISFEFMLCNEFDDTNERALVLANALGRQTDLSRIQYNALKTAVGAEEAALWLFRGYFTSNYFYEMMLVPPGVFQTVYEKSLSSAERDSRYYGMMSDVFSIGLTLSKAFRHYTASAFFKMIGLSGDLKIAYEFDLYSALQSDGYCIQSFRRLYRELS